MKNLFPLIFFLNILFCVFFPKLVSAQQRPELNAYPYQFKETINICFALYQADTVTLAIYNRWGEIVGSILDKEWKDSGNYSYQYKADTLTNGVYILAVQTQLSKGKAFSISKYDSASDLELSVYPNPFLDSTTIQFKLPERARISIEAYDMTGKNVEQIVQDSLFEADTTIRLYFNAIKLPAGFYFINFRINNCYSTTKKAVKTGTASLVSNLGTIYPEIKAFPNPFQDNITISGLGKINGKVEIVNSLGQIVKTQNLQSQQEINLQLTDFPAGAYFIRILDNSKNIPSINKLIIKN